MDARQDRVPGWMFGAAGATAVLSMLCIGQLSFHTPRATQPTTTLASQEWPTLGPAPVVIAAAPPAKREKARPAVVAEVAASEVVATKTHEQPAFNETANLLPPLPQPAEILTFPLAGPPMEGAYDPVASLPPVDLLKTVGVALNEEWRETPVNLDDLIVTPIDLDASEIVVLQPASPRWRAESAAKRWTVFGVEGARSAKQVGQLSATLINRGRGPIVAAMNATSEAATSLAAAWTKPRLAGVIHSPPALASPVAVGPQDRLALAVSPDVLPISPNNNRVVDDNTTPPAGGAEPIGEDEDQLATPTTLLEQVRLLMVEPATSTWAMRVETALDAALAVRPGDTERFQQVSRELRSLALEGSDLAEIVDTERAAVLLRRACYGIFRRITAWDLTVQIEARQRRLSEFGNDPAIDPRYVTSVDPRWERVAKALSPQHSGRFFACAEVNASSRPIVLTSAAFRSSMRDAVDSARDPRSFVAKLEAYERLRSPRLASLVADDLAACRESSDATERRLAERVDGQYRNANVRVAISRKLLERLLPKDESRKTRLNDRLLGAQVRGTATTDSQLALHLEPDANRWRVNLAAEGTVKTRTAAISGPVVLHSRGATRFVASKAITLDTNGLRTTGAQCEATNQTRLVGIDSRLDVLPVVRRVVRSRAEEGYAASRSVVRRHAERQVEQRVARALDTDAAAVFNEMQRRYEQDVVDRARRLGMALTPVEIRTTEQRLIARLRMASEDQLGSHTPRTRAPSDSLASLQLHESALNNAAAGLGLAGERFTAETLRQRLADQLMTPSIVDEDLDTPRIELRFADAQPLSITLGDGAARLVLAIAEMRLGRSRYRNFRVHATYEPRPVGAAAIVHRTGAIEIEGRLRTASRLKLHGVFGKVLSEERPITLLAPPANDNRFDDLMITQMVMDDGWLGVALGPAKSPGIRGERVAIAGRYLR